MRKALFLFTVWIISCHSNFSYGQRNYPSLSEATLVKIYKTIDTISLKAYIFNPPGQQATEPRSAIVFFFGGGWQRGTPAQFVSHCKYLAHRGMVAITVDYRVGSRHGVKANTCVEDAKSAIRWMRQNAKQLGINPDKIVAAGGSAGGHLAASTTTLPEHDAPQDDLSISSMPNALALFNPVLITAKVNDHTFFNEQAVYRFQSRMGAPLESMSPFHHIKSSIGPTIIFHGTKDQTVPIESVLLFDDKMEAHGNACTLVAYEGEEHGFFNYLRKENGPFIDTMNKLDQFLVRNGYLPSIPRTISY